MVSGTTPASRATAAMLVAPYPCVPKSSSAASRIRARVAKRLLLAKRRMISTFVHTLVSFQYRTVQFTTASL